MNAIFSRRIPFLTSDGGAALLYFLLEDAAAPGTAPFGVRVVKLDARERVMEEAECLCAARDRTQAFRILSLLADGSVPPCTLAEVLEDLALSAA